MWLRLETQEEVQIFPDGEENFHEWADDCECDPEIVLMPDLRTMITHNPHELWDLLDLAYYNVLHTTRQLYDA